MAARTLTEYIDDLDEGPADTTVTFALDNATYEIDLSDENAAQLRGLLEPYRVAGRKVATAGAKSKRRAAGATSAGGGEAAAIREWAAENNIEVNERGRVSRTVRDLYNQRLTGVPHAA